MKYKTIILASSRDFCSCPLSSSLATCLWPVVGTAVIERLLVGLSAQGVSEAVVCSNGCGSVIDATIDKSKCPSLTFLDEPFPIGTAGCIRQAVSIFPDDSDSDDSLLVILQGSMVSPPAIDELISAHQRGAAEMTVFFNPQKQPAIRNQQSVNNKEKLASGIEQSEILKEDHRLLASCSLPIARGIENAGVYVCNSSVLEHIPQEGYLDIKESLIPNLLAAGKKVHHATLTKNVCNFRSSGEYLLASADAFNGAGGKGLDVEGLSKLKGTDDVWVASDVDIATDARLVGPVAVLDGAKIESGVVVLGPAVVGRNSIVGSGSVIVKSILWDGALVGSGCRLSDSVVAANTIIEDDAVIAESAVAALGGGFLEKIMRKVFKGGVRNVISCDSKPKKSKNVVSGGTNPNLAGGVLAFSGRLAAGCFVLFAIFLWSFWPNLKDLWAMWMGSDEFSSGLLVPMLAVYVLWSRRDSLKDVRIKPAVFVGVAAFVFAQFVRLAGTFLMSGFLERFSIVLCVFSVVLLLFGWRFFWKIFSVLLFLLLMLPWPNQVQAKITLPLQSWATESAVFSLEMIGYDVAREGNIITIGDTTVAVAEACNGLRMITAFFVIIGLIVLLVDRPKWEKILVFASCLPIALMCNTIRLAVTSIAFTYLKGPRWEGLFHDFGGYAMMPLALAIAIGQLWLLKALTTPPQEIKYEVVEKQQIATSGQQSASS